MKLKILLYLIVIIFIQGCVAGAQFVKPNMIDPSYFKQQINTITVLPVLDDRRDKSISLDYPLIVRARISSFLIGEKNFDIKSAYTYGSLQNITVDEVTQPTQEWIQQLGKEDETHLLLIVLHDIEDSPTFGRMVNAELSGYLFDRKQGKLIWKNKAVAQTGQGGLIGLMMSSNVFVQRALRKVAKELIDGFPSKGMTQEMFAQVAQEKVLDSPDEEE